MAKKSKTPEIDADKAELESGPTVDNSILAKDGYEWLGKFAREHMMNRQYLVKLVKNGKVDGYFDKKAGKWAIHVDAYKMHQSHQFTPIRHVIKCSRETLQRILTEYGDEVEVVK